MKNLIALQDEYSAAVLAAKHQGGRAHRVLPAARKRLAARLTRWGFTDTQVTRAIKQAEDMAHLAWLCGE